MANAAALFRDAGLAGNVTLPHKESLAALVDDRTETCQRVGACNTFWTANGVLVGDNTDVEGVLGALDALDAPEDGTWLVLGTGGAARAVAVAAATRGALLFVHSRTHDRAAEFASWAGSLGMEARPVEPRDEPDIVVNATPLGLREDDPLPVEPDAVASCRVALDLVYRPGGTPWANAMRRAHISAADGRVMLVEQGIRAFERFFPGQQAPREVMRGAVERALRP
jgi:shikimate dehydrogenase